MVFCVLTWLFSKEAVFRKIILLFKVTNLYERCRYGAQGQQHVVVLRITGLN